MDNMFTSQPQQEWQNTQPIVAPSIGKPDYNVCRFGLFNKILAFLMGFAVGFFIFFIFYKLVILSIVGGALLGIVNIFLAMQKAVKKRMSGLRTQFFDLLEAMSVAMRAGNPPFIALQSARDDLVLIYSPDTDIIREIDIIILMFQNNVPLSVSFDDFAQRCKLDDIKSFASVYKTIEGKAGNTSEIVRQTQEIIADKMEIEMEIDTMMTAAKSEVNIMLIMPLVILGVIGYAGAGFMDSIYTTMVGRVVSTFGLSVLIMCYFMATKFSNIKL